jgi:hypothetical protein
MGACLRANCKKIKADQQPSAAEKLMLGICEKSGRGSRTSYPPLTLALPDAEAVLVSRGSPFAGKDYSQ